MSARLVRSVFASPFVVTLAACTANPPPASPAPEPAPVTAVDGRGTPAGSAAEGRRGSIENPPRPTPTPTPVPVEPPVTGNPPPGDPTPPPRQVSWTYMAQGDSCHAMAEITCNPGATCNPPPPMKVECPANVTLPAKVHEFGGVCTVARVPQACPAGMHCNPPPPQRVKCPG